MKKTFLRPAWAFLLLTLFFSTEAMAQGGQKPRLSPADSASGTVGKAHISIKYSAPSVRGRQIWDSLVPYGKVWRAGANEATTFTTDRDIMVEGKKLPAGTYALFMIPTGDKGWTIIFNKTANQWGAFKYDEKQDALRVSVQPRKASGFTEQLKYVISASGFSLLWEKLEVPVTIKG